MADSADRDGAALDETIEATPGSSGESRPVAADATALEIDESDRYALVGVHAAGGLGRVMRARDPGGGPGDRPAAGARAAIA